MGNILAEEQKKLYDPNLSAEEYQERERCFLELYYHLREKSEKSFFGRLNLKTRKRLHWLILGTYRIKNRLGGFTFELLHDHRTHTDRPVIFAVTHVGKFDIEVTSEAIRDHYYLLSGDYEHIQGTIDAPFLNVNGVIYFNEKVLSDRNAVSKRMIDHLHQGSNLMYFPEGTWNLSPNLPVLPCYWGIVEVAQRGNAVIVPVAAEQYGKHFIINIGENFDMNKYGIDKALAINALRDVLATLKWEIWESRPIQRRKDLDINEWNIYIANRFREWPYFNLTYIDGLVFKPKQVARPEDVWFPIATIQNINGKNASHIVYASQLLTKEK